MGCCPWAVKQTRCKTTIDSTAAMCINLGRSERQPGAYVVWLPSELRAVSTSDALFDKTFFPWRPKGDQRPEDPPPLPGPGDGDAAQPPTVPPADEGLTYPSRIESNLAVEFARASQKGPHFASYRRRSPLAGYSSYSRGRMRALAGWWPSCSAWASRSSQSTMTPAEETRHTTSSATTSTPTFCAAPREASSSPHGRHHPAQPSQSVDFYRRERPAAAHQSFVVDKKGKSPVPETAHARIRGS